MTKEFEKIIFSFAYNMMGDYNGSKDVVQDIHLKFIETPIPDNISDKKNYIIKTTVNHCLNILQRQKKFTYVGTWLPEPIITNNPIDLNSTKFERSNLLTYELAFLMEQLTPTERAVFVLREAFDFDHKEIAEAISISPDNSRQLLKRTKEKIAHRKHNTISDQRSLETAKQFVHYISEGKLEELIALFNDDISIIGDGGGKVPAISQAIYGKEHVAKFLLNIFSNKHFSPFFQLTEILSQPAIVVSHNGVCAFVQVLSLSENKISQIFAVLNPDKLSAFKS